ncbi:hypothetical protein DIPPA_20465 [Diplonema papillatum]|nr:hypothetical protein DIPPA_20465 [Diplonema papillatum]
MQDNLCTAITRLRQATVHRPDEEIYYTEGSQTVLLVPTLTPTDELGVSALDHYCLDLRTVTLKLNHLHSQPASVNAENLQWACRTLVKYRRESQLVRYIGEILYRLCRGTESSPNTAVECEPPPVSKDVAGKRCGILYDCGVVPLISDLVGEIRSASEAEKESEDYSNIVMGVLSCIQALCVGSASTTPDVGSVKNVVATVFEVIRPASRRRDTDLVVAALKTLAVLVCPQTIDEVLALGAPQLLLSLMQLRFGDKTSVITASVLVIRRLCSFEKAVATLLSSGVVSQLLRAIVMARDVFPSALLLYDCLKRVSSPACAADLKKYYAIQTLVTSSAVFLNSTSREAIEVLVAVLGCLHSVTIAAQAYLSLTFAGLNVMIDMLVKYRSNVAVAEATCKVLQACLFDDQARNQFGPHAHASLVESMPFFEAEPSVLVILLDIFSILAADAAFGAMLLDKSCVRVLRGFLEDTYRTDPQICTNVARCTLPLSLQRRHAVLAEILPPLLGCERGLRHPALADVSLLVILSCCHSDQDRIAVFNAGGFDLVLRRTVSHGDETPELTLNSLILFSTMYKRELLAPEIVHVLLRIYDADRKAVDGTDGGEPSTVQRLLVALLQSLLVCDGAEDIVLGSDLRNLF